MGVWVYGCMGVCMFSWFVSSIILVWASISILLARPPAYLLVLFIAARHEAEAETEAGVGAESEAEADNVREAECLSGRCGVHDVELSFIV